MSAILSFQFVVSFKFLVKRVKSGGGTGPPDIVNIAYLTVQISLPIAVQYSFMKY